MSSCSIPHTDAISYCTVTKSNSVEGVSNIIRLLALIWRQQTTCCKVDLGQSAVNIDHRYFQCTLGPWMLQSYCFLIGKQSQIKAYTSAAVSDSPKQLLNTYVAWWMCSCSIPHTIAIVLYYTVVYCARSTVTPTGSTHTEGIIQGHLMGPDLAPADCLFSGQSRVEVL